MPEDIYPVEFDHSIGRAYVKLSGEINAVKIGNTFSAIAMNKSWLNGNRSILWQAENTYLSDLFEFSDILKTTQISRAFAKPGKSAFVAETSSAMIERVANFYKSIATTTTDRKIEIFLSEKEAMEWLDK
jgi:hypothetical protein